VRVSVRASASGEGQPTGLRRRADLEAEYAAAVAERAAVAHQAQRRERAQAVIDALTWVLGHGPAAPLSGTTVAGQVTNIHTGREIALALDILYGPHLVEQARRRPYAAGVEHALLWASYATPVPPITYKYR
jgi:hypothetical protein